MAGRISFTLPSVPDVMPEADLLDEELRTLGWTDKIQFYAESWDDGEFMAHIADLRPALEKLRADYPDKEELDYQMNAMLRLAEFYLNLYDGDFVVFPEPNVLEVEGEEFVECRFTFAYPDSPGVEYRGRGIMDGTLAVLLMVEADEENLRILEDMHVATRAEADAFYSRPPVTVTLEEMRITFPHQPDSSIDEDGIFYDVFTSDFSYLSAEFSPFPFGDYMDHPESPQAELMAYAEYFGEKYREDGAFDSFTLESVADGIALCRGTGTLETVFDDYAELQTIVYLYFTPDGLYEINSDDSEQGLAFLDSIVFPGAAE